jgi:phenylacetate-coenzyme A ligase PaaK-like adenylate-forming protein
MLDPEKIFNIKSETGFHNLALEIFHYQSENVAVYKDFIAHLKINPSEIIDYRNIPFLPVELFKSLEINAIGKNPEIIFESSVTTGNIPSRHFVADLKVYEQSFLNGFGHFYGNVSEMCILALLPSYLERSGSSLVYMAEELIRKSGHPESGFYLNDQEKLISVLRNLKNQQQKVLLLGVSFALLELSEKYEENLEGIIVMETGGMKGRRNEMVREDLHSYLKKRFNLKQIHSEYGMTELLSQAYSMGEGIFYCPPWMKILVRDSYDPFQYMENEHTGSINVIDLANIYSCSFIATSDIGRLHENGGFEVLGRMEYSDIRGCNLMIDR